MTTWNERLSERLREIGMRPAELARAVKVSTATVSDWESGAIKTIKGGNLIKVSATLGVNPDWLLDGREPKVGAGEPRGTYLQQQQDGDSIRIQLFDAAASMGGGLTRPATDTVLGEISLSSEWARRHLSMSSPNNLAVLTAYGDSMNPTFADGDLLLVDRGVTDIKLDAVYVLSLNEELFVKRVQRRITDGAVVIKSDNPLYDPVVLTNGERQSLEVLGRVVWAWNGRKL